MDNNISLLIINKLMFASRVSSFNNDYQLNYEPWANALIEKQFDVEGINRLCEFFKEHGEFLALAQSILTELPAIYGEEEISAFNCGILTDLIRNIKEEDWTKEPLRNYSNKSKETLTSLKEIRFFMDQLDQIAACFTPHTVGDFTIYIDAATMDIIVLKDGKALRSILATHKKSPYIKKLKDIKRELAVQHKRAGTSFEKAMESQDGFLYEEILDLLKHPVIRPIVTKLVFSAGEKIGFLCEEGMREIDGTLVSLDKKTDLVVAHSCDLYQSGRWSEFQRYAFEHELVQPFRQIFRELYLISDDERKERTISRRYAGNQVQPEKTADLLKGRRWTVDYDNGLQKVDYKENIIATIHAQAEWFSPAGVEALTLETVMFRNRNSYKPLAFEDMSPVLFSEIMRDLDLVVSAAHTGGVSPAASRSTVEMRGMIAREIAGLLKLTNVTTEGNHSKVIGTKGDYSVHLGSGIAHMSGKGTLNILPVHSQYLGRGCLSFLDEDPKTAEILSKILLLAKDDKIKDIAILNQIV